MWSTKYWVKEKNGEVFFVEKAFSLLVEEPWFLLLFMAY